MTLVAACAALVLTACNSSSSSQRSLVQLTAPVFVTASGDTVAMSEAVRIGSLDGPDTEQFTLVTSLSPRPAGGVTVFDGGNDDGGSAIRDFDGNGSLVRSIGRQGEGPGEYSRYPFGTRLKDGSLVVADQSLARITRYDTAGDVLGISRAYGSLVDIHHADDGGWYTAAVVGQPTTDTPRQIMYYRYGPDGALVDSIPAPDQYASGPWGNAYGPRSMTIILPGGETVASRTDSIAITIVGPQGARTFARQSDRARYHPEEKAALVRRVEAAARQRNLPVPPMEIPDLKQAFSYMTSDDEGRILFRRRTLAERRDSTAASRPGETLWRGRVEVDVFDRDGTYRGRVIGSRDATGSGIALGDGMLWLVHEGESGELYVVGWRPAREAW